jgi:hypothetical protein
VHWIHVTQDRECCCEHGHNLKFFKRLEISWLAVWQFTFSRRTPIHVVNWFCPLLWHFSLFQIEWRYLLIFKGKWMVGYFMFRYVLPGFAQCLAVYTFPTFL